MADSDLRTPHRRVEWSGQAECLERFASVFSQGKGEEPSQKATHPSRRSKKLSVRTRKNPGQANGPGPCVSNTSTRRIFWKSEESRSGEAIADGERSPANGAFRALEEIGAHSMIDNPFGDYDVSEVRIGFFLHRRRYREGLRAQTNQRFARTPGVLKLDLTSSVLPPRRPWSLPRTCPRCT